MSRAIKVLLEGPYVSADIGALVIELELVMNVYRLGSVGSVDIALVKG